MSETRPAAGPAPQDAPARADAGEPLSTPAADGPRAPASGCAPAPAGAAPAAAPHLAAAVDPWVARWAHLAPPGEVLDLACGGGRHARLFAARGHPVLALDRDSAALAALAADAAVERLAPPAPAAPRPAPITTMLFDLERDPAGADWPFAPGRFAAIVVTNYLHRPLMARLVEALRPDGVLLYATFAAGQERFGRPRNPAFLLEDGELLRLPLRVIAYESGVRPGSVPAQVQCLAAGGPAWRSENARLAPESSQE